MSQFSDYLENALINATLRGVNFTAPTAVYLALFTLNPGDTGAGTEVSGGGYARRPITFTAPSNGVTSNSAEVLFNAATANWGTITHIGIYDATTGGNLLYYSPISNAKTINADDQLKVSTGDIIVSLA
jgi:hypothetical protein